MFDESPCNWQRRGTNRSLLHGWPLAPLAAACRERAQLPDQNVVRGGTVRDLDARRSRAEGPRIQRWLEKYVMGCAVLPPGYSGRLW